MIMNRAEAMSCGGFPQKKIKRENGPVVKPAKKRTFF
jgi:hypothetical protein